MRSLTNACIFVLGILFVGVDSQSTSQFDQCIDQAFARFHQALTSKFPQYENFTVTLPSSRHLFQILLMQNFTADALRDYCRAYESARKEYDQCADSVYKKVVLSGFSLADYICLKRLNDYATGLPCLERAHKAASDVCRGKCSQYEQASYSYLHPTDSQSNSDMTTYMAGDCQYLKCWMDCRSPYLENQCDNKTASLELDSLIAAYSSLRELYEPATGPSTPAPAAGQHTPTFPNECRPFVAQKSAETSLSDATTNATRDSGSAGISTRSSTTQTNSLLRETTRPHGGASKPVAVDRSVFKAVASAAILWTMILALAK